LREVFIRNRKIRFLTFGNESDHAIVILQGWAMDAKVYQSLAELYAQQGYYVVVPSLPGFGGSNTILDLSFASVAEQVNLFLKEMGVSRAILVAHSMGGPIALELATHHGHRVREIVLFGSAGVPPKRSQIGWVWAGIRNVVANLTTRGAFRRGLGVLLRTSWYATLHPLWYYRSFLLTIRADLSSLPNRIREKKIHLVSGTKDLYFPVDLAIALSRKLGVEPVWEEWGHDGIYTRPARAAEISQQFFSTGVGVK
jgi:pimeloyl-ACP methyl ester carboxylesterase